MNFHRLYFLEIVFSSKENIPVIFCRFLENLDKTGDDDEIGYYFYYYYY